MKTGDIAKTTSESTERSGMHAQIQE